MDIVTAYSEYRRRLRDWLVQDFYREIDNDYPILRTIRQSFAEIDLIYFRTLPEPEMRATARGMIRQFVFGDATWTEELSRDEREDLEAYLEWVNGRNARALRRGTADTQVPIINKREAAAGLIPALQEALGLKIKGRSSLWGFDVRHGDWGMSTSIDFSGRFGISAKLYFMIYPQGFGAYNQTVGPSDGLPINSTGFLGMTTTYDFVSVEDVKPIADSMASIISGFMAGFPTIVEGLDVG